MKNRHAIRALTLLGTALFVCACGDLTDVSAPAADPPAAPSPLLAMTCTASLETSTVDCAPVRVATKTVAQALILGGQDEYVTLTSDNVSVAGGIFSFDVTVTNLIQQSLGTTNGVSIHPEGVRVFFAAPPTSTGAGTVTVANPDGFDTFMTSEQPYYHYETALSQDMTSYPKTWQLAFTPEVTAFTFGVYVSAEVQFPDGYVEVPYVLTLNPGETRELVGTVRTAVGTEVPAETVSWVSNNDPIAQATGSQLTAGGSNGFALLTANSGIRPGIRNTAVSVCPAVIVTNGTSLPSSIANTDCFSSYGSSNGLPTTSYYADLYRVTLTAGQTITVTMDSGNVLDTFLLLVEPGTGRLVAGNDDAESLGVGSRMDYTATVTGVHVIEASTFNGLDTGAYTLGVTIS